MTQFQKLIDSLTGAQLDALKRSGKLHLLENLTDSQIQILKGMSITDIANAVALFVEEAIEVVETVADVLDDGKINNSAKQVVEEALSPHRYNIQDVLRQIIPILFVLLGSFLTSLEWKLGATFGIPFIFSGIIFTVYFAYDKHGFIEFETLTEIKRGNTSVAVFSASVLLAITACVLVGSTIVSAVLRDGEATTDNLRSQPTVESKQVPTPPTPTNQPAPSNGTATED